LDRVLVRYTHAQFSARARRAGLESPHR
jgi:hypothetical protein